MGTSLDNGRVQVLYRGNFTNALDLTQVTDALAYTKTQDFLNGTGANKLGKHWSDQRSLTTGTNETLDLTALTGGAFGNVSFSKIKVIIIVVTTTTAGYTLEVGGAGTTPFSACFKDPSDIAVAGAGGYLVLTAPVDGMTVDSTHKSLKINNPTGGTINYDIVIAGE